MSGYCRFAPGHPIHGPYHDNEYGFPIRDDAALFLRLIMEINQAGLSWETILRKREGFERAYHGGDPQVIARYDDTDRARLMADAGIIRNRLKIDAAIHNAKRVVELIAEHGSFANWIDAQGELDKAAWVKRMKKEFRFVGGEIVGEFLMSIGKLPGAHAPDCPVFARLSSS